MKPTEVEALVLFTKEKLFKKMWLMKYIPIKLEYLYVTLLLFMRFQQYQVSEKAGARDSDFDILIFRLFLVRCLEIWWDRLLCCTVKKTTLNLMQTWLMTSAPTWAHQTLLRDLMKNPSNIHLWKWALKWICVLLVFCKDKVKLALENTLHLGMSAKVYSLAQILTWLSNQSES